MKKRSYAVAMSGSNDGGEWAVYDSDDSAGIAVELEDAGGGDPDAARARETVKLTPVPDGMKPAPAAVIDLTTPKSMPPPDVPVARHKPPFQEWEVDPSRFEIKRMLGRGSYGQVAEAKDLKTGARVAIKRVFNVFDVFENAVRIYREVKILGRLDHPNIIKIVHLHYPKNPRSFKDLYIVFECMDTDFARLTRDDTQALTVAHVRWFLYQLLLGMKFIHSADIIHRDMKPANVLLTEDCNLKICDFGLARCLETKPTPVKKPPTATATGPESKEEEEDIGLPPKIARQFTKHVVTRWYRAPELPLYNDGNYTPKIDVWSVGCVYAEMLGMLDTDDLDCRFDRKALFPGASCYPLSRGKAGDGSAKSSKRDQMSVIFDVMGTPKPEEIARVRTAETRKWLTELPKKEGKNLKELYPTAGDEAIDLLRQFLRFLPEDRCTIDDALAHPFLRSVRRPKDEIGRPEGAIMFPSPLKGTIRMKMLEEIRRYNPEIPADRDFTTGVSGGGGGGAPRVTPPTVAAAAPAPAPASNPKPGKPVGRAVSWTDEPST